MSPPRRWSTCGCKDPPIELGDLLSPFIAPHRSPQGIHCCFRLLEAPHRPIDLPLDPVGIAPVVRFLPEYGRAGHRAHRQLRVGPAEIGGEHAGIAAAEDDPLGAERGDVLCGVEPGDELGDVGERLLGGEVAEVGGGQVTTKETFEFWKFKFPIPTCLPTYPRPLFRPKNLCSR